MVRGNFVCFFLFFVVGCKGSIIDRICIPATKFKMFLLSSYLSDSECDDRCICIVPDSLLIWLDICKWRFGLRLMVSALFYMQELQHRLQRVIHKWGLKGTTDQPSVTEYKEEMRKIRKYIVDFHGEMVLLMHYSNINYTGNPSKFILFFSSFLFWSKPTFLILMKISELWLG